MGGHPKAGKVNFSTSGLSWKVQCSMVDLVRNSRPLSSWFGFRQTTTDVDLNYAVYLLGNGMIYYPYLKTRCMGRGVKNIIVNCFNGGL